MKLPTLHLSILRPLIAEPLLVEWHRAARDQAREASKSKRVGHAPDTREETASGNDTLRDSLESLWYCLVGRLAEGKSPPVFSFCIRPRPQPIIKFSEQRTY